MTKTHYARTSIDRHSPATPRRIFRVRHSAVLQQYSAAPTLEREMRSDTGTTLRAGNAGKQRIDVRGCGPLRRRPRLSRPRGRMRAVDEEGRERDCGAGVHRAGLGPDHPGGPGQRPGYAVVPRRPDRGRHRRPRHARRDHRAQSPHRPRRVVGRCHAHPARVEARAHEADRPRSADRGSGRPVQRPGNREGEPTRRGPHLRCR